MAKYKNKLIYLQILFVFLIPISPHFYLSNNLQLDDIPVLLFFLLFLLNVYLKNITKFFFIELMPVSIFTFYIFLQNIFVNGSFLFTEGFRYIFYITIFVTLLNSNDLNHYSNFFKYLTIFLNIFAILFFIIQVNFGTDLYNYWKIGFNENQWIFTDGRMNGLQAGGPNAFGGLIASSNLYCIANTKSSFKNFYIITGTLACFFTYSRAALLIFVFIVIVHLILSKKVYEIGLLFITLLVTINFGLIERNTSELETEGIQDRVQMQQATVLDISNRSLENNLFGYGHGNFRVIRNNIKQTSDFDEGSRPTGPHNSFLFLILDYGFVGLLLFLSLIHI